MLNLFVTGGTRRVVLLLPDGNFMMTEVDEEQYAALELDKWNELETKVDKNVWKSASKW